MCGSCPCSAMDKPLSKSLQKIDDDLCLMVSLLTILSSCCQCGTGVIAHAQYGAEVFL